MFPENPDLYRLNHPTGAILISYAGSSFKDHKVIGAGSLMRVLQVSLIVLMRSLNSEKGAISVLDQLRSSLNDHIIDGCFDGITCKSEKFIANNDGIWQFVLDVEIPQLIRG